MFICYHHQKGQDKNLKISHHFVLVDLRETFLQVIIMKEENHDHHDVIDSLYFSKLSLKNLVSMTHKKIIFIYSRCFKSFQTFKERLSDQFIIMKMLILCHFGL